MTYTTRTIAATCRVTIGGLDARTVQVRLAVAPTRSLHLAEDNLPAVQRLDADDHGTARPVRDLERPLAHSGATEGLKPAALKPPSKASASARRSRRMTMKLVASTNEYN